MGPSAIRSATSHSLQLALVSGHLMQAKTKPLSRLCLHQVGIK